jgi:hypothetical protein
MQNDKVNESKSEIKNEFLDSHPTVAYAYNHQLVKR